MDERTIAIYDEITLQEGDYDGDDRPGDDLPGRWFSFWTSPTLEAALGRSGDTDIEHGRLRGGIWVAGRRG